MKRILSSLLIIIFCHSIAISQSQNETQRKRLVELNTAIQDLEQKAQDLTKQKKALEAEPPKEHRAQTFHVKGYYRKDGTYVKPHTRSAPRRKP